MVSTFKGLFTCRQTVKWATLYVRVHLTVCLHKEVSIYGVVHLISTYKLSRKGGFHEETFAVDHIMSCPFKGFSIMINQETVELKGCPLKGLST